MTPEHVLSLIQSIDRTSEVLKDTRSLSSPEFKWCNDPLGEAARSLLNARDFALTELGRAVLEERENPPLDLVPAEMLRDLLLLVEIEVSQEAIEGWTPLMRAEAEAWAGAVHLRASDNDDIVVPTRPSWLPLSETEKRLQKRTPDQWLATEEFRHIEIVDPDGWDRSNFTESWARPLTLAEFRSKLAYCTIRPRPVHAGWSDDTEDLNK